MPAIITSQQSDQDTTVHTWSGTPLPVVLTNATRHPDLSIGTEAANVILLSVQVVDHLGADVAAVTPVHVRMYEATMIEALAAAVTLADGGAGSLVSTTANASVIATTDATGLLEVDVTDAAGASGKTFYAEVEVFSSSTSPAYLGGKSYIAITFD